MFCKKEMTAGFPAAVLICDMDHFFLRYFTLSRATAAMMIAPLNTNWRFVSIPRNVRQ